MKLFILIALKEENGWFVSKTGLGLRQWADVFI
jgi:hypothetical protein